MLRELFGSSSSDPLRPAFEEVQRMLRQAGTMLDHALGALLDNHPLEVDLDDLDDVVDEGEQAVRRIVLRHLAIQPKHDLVASLILVSMVQDAERIGDFARGLAEMVPLARSERGGVWRDDLRTIADEIRPLFKLTDEAFLEDDAEKARKVVATASETKRKLIAYTARVAASDLTADMAVVYSASARMLRRIGSHLSNICSTVSQPYDRIRHGDEDV